MSNSCRLTCCGHQDKILGTYRAETLARNPARRKRPAVTRTTTAGPQARSSVAQRFHETFTGRLSTAACRIAGNAAIVHFMPVVCTPIYTINKIISMYAKAGRVLVDQRNLDIYPSLDRLLRRRPWRCGSWPFTALLVWPDRRHRVVGTTC